MFSLRRWSLSQFAGIPVFLAVFLLFWIWFRGYQAREREYLHERNLRAVDAVATHIENTLTATDKALHALAEAGPVSDYLEDGSEESRIIAMFRTFLRPRSRFPTIEVRSQRLSAPSCATAATECMTVVLVRSAGTSCTCTGSSVCVRASSSSA